MTDQNRLCLAVCSLLFFLPAFLRAQDKMPVKFGKVTPDDFKVTASPLDTSADVVVVADYGESSFDGNSQGWFSTNFKRTRRLRILKRTGFEAATIQIPLLIDGGSSEKVYGLKAATYTLEDGKVVETKLDSKSVFFDKYNKDVMVEKFTFPNIKEGAILEYSYTQNSPFLHLQEWEFQGRYPILWSEYQAQIPNFFKYVTLSQGFLPFKINTSDSRNVSFHVTLPGGAGADEHGSFDDEVVTHRWVMQNVPALKPEPYTTTVDNYISKIEFQMAGYMFPNSPYHDRMGSWAKICETMMQDDNFGADLNRNNSWMDDDIKSATRGATGNLEKAQKIFGFVRDNFSCTDRGYLYMAGPLKTVYKDRKGNEAELNLVLTAMLLHAGLDAKPVILSTRENGFVHSFYPLLSRYNCVICAVTIDGKRYCLDASDRWIGFGKLPVECYNGEGRIIDKDQPIVVPLNADSVVEGKVTMAIITGADKGGMDATVQSMPGIHESSELRQEVKEHGQPAFLKKIQAAYSGDAAVSDLQLDSLKQPDLPLEIAYDVHFAPDSSSDIYYFNPMLTEAYKENPFKAANRSYPVEMPCAMDETYTLVMDVPTGYVVDELPKSARVNLNGDEGVFEYLIQGDGAHVQLRSRIKLTKANFEPEDYSSLRDFFGYIVKKQSEQIVFKKKK